jgi:hypothetical protein
MRAWTLAVVISSSLVGCADPDPNPNPPTPPTDNDPAFSIRGLQDWYHVPDGAQPGQNQATFIVTAPSDADYVDAYIPGVGVQRMQEQSDGYALDISIADVPVGTHDILFSANNSTKAFAKATFHRSFPYYVLVTTDYDFSDPGDNAIQYMDTLHSNHPGMLITHFWAPYTYTDSAVTPERRDVLDTWIKKQQAEMHDEIGLHIHPWCNFVDTTGVTCITDKSTVYDTDDTGYTINLSAYSRTEMGTLLQHAAQIFNGRGLPTPRTFRAGGWTADASTLLALADNGYVADSSALNWKYIEEWEGKELYTWTMSHWSQITDTSQPYYPSTTDAQLTQPGSNVTTLEVPDNGVMIDYVTTAEMQAIFDANFDGQPLEKPRTLTMGFHPAAQFSRGEFLKVDTFLKYADSKLAAVGTGPVYYISLSDVTKAFPAQ